MAPSPTAAPAETSPEIRDYWPSRTDNAVLRSLVGFPFKEAESFATQLAENVNVESPDGGTPMILAPSNWVVVAHEPAAGEELIPGWPIKLIVAKKDDPVALEALSEYGAGDRTHALERRFTGEVSAVASSERESPTGIVVDEALLELDLIQPIADGCDPTDGYSEAMAAKDALLPPGSRVLVERVERNRPKAFVHLLEGAVPADGTTRGTANELLVRSGWWEPTQDFAGELQDEYSDSLFASYEPASYWNDRELDYAMAIASAGNETTPRTEVGGMAECRRLAEVDRDASQVLQAERDREFDLWYTEYKPRVASGYYSCIDGDGDGVCHER